MSRLIFRINPHTDGDIIAYLQKQPNRSDAIRQAIRLAMEREDNINEMMHFLSNPPVNDEGLEIGSIEWIAREVIKTGNPITDYTWLHLPVEETTEELVPKIEAEIERIKSEDAKTNP